MKMTALAAAALVFTAGSAIAGSGHYGSNEGQKPATASDNTYTSSTRKMNNDAGVPKTVRKPVFNDEYGKASGVTDPDRHKIKGPGRDLGPSWYLSYFLER
ncbi:DUF680 domain-containing protein [Mesorhizobium sp. M0847]|uniref:DUF680 domain-containing protein n=1 Tax=unclassified Mesorhizobium TaxID=325217 RepID=UPI003338E353